MRTLRQQIGVLLIGGMAWLQSASGATQSSRFVFHTDALGSVAAITDSAQQTVKGYSHEAFGKIRSETGNSLVVNRYTYTAREALGDSLGLYYYRWRVMDPNVGRFTSEDPLGFVDGLNFFAYVGNSPAANADPLGLMRSDQAKCKCEREGGRWVADWEIGGYASDWDCANKKAPKYGSASQMTQGTWILIGGVSYRVPAVGQVVFVKYSAEWLGALVECMTFRCVK